MNHPVLQLGQPGTGDHLALSLSPGDAPWGWSTTIEVEAFPFAGRLSDTVTTDDLLGFVRGLAAGDLPRVVRLTRLASTP